MALVDIAHGKSRHVHYRDSKLTFLLRVSVMHPSSIIGLFCSYTLLDYLTHYVCIHRTLLEAMLRPTLLPTFILVQGILCTVKK